MKISENKQAQEGMVRVLTGNYPRITDDQVSELLRLLGNAEAEEVMDAIDAHITSEKGQFPPQAGQVMEQMRRKAEREKPNPFHRDPFANRPKTGRKTVPVPERYRAYTKTGAIEVWPVRCHSCGDTGIARFYHDVKKRVWLADEAHDLPDAMFAKLRMASAVCDCKTGTYCRERSLLAIHTRTQREMPLYPRLEFIKRKAAQRRASDLQEVA